MKIHLQSDTHVEMGPTMPPAVASDLTICAGDNGLLGNLPQLKKYFDMIREGAEDIIWVLGNHEFYHSNYDEALLIAEKFAKEEGIYLMDEALGTDNLELNGVKFWGSTLWTDLKGGDYFVVDKIGHGFNDCYVIGKDREDEKGSFSSHDMMEINARTREKINWDADVIITHHCPLVVKHRNYPLDDITYGFCNTGLEEQIINTNVKYLLYGHTHDSTNFDCGGTNIISNQHGYARESWQTGETMYEDCGYDPRLIIEI